MTDGRQEIVQVVEPEQVFFTLPNATAVSSHSHTLRDIAFSALALGITTSNVEHVLATQTLTQAKSKKMLIKATGKLKPGIASKYLVRHIIGQIDTAGGSGIGNVICWQSHLCLVYGSLHVHVQYGY